MPYALLLRNWLSTIVRLVIVGEFGPSVPLSAVEAFIAKAYWPVMFRTTMFLNVRPSIATREAFW